jgi:hypothetical protein
MLPFKNIDPGPPLANLLVPDYRTGPRTPKFLAVLPLLDLLEGLLFREPRTWDTPLFLVTLTTRLFLLAFVIDSYTRTFWGVLVVICNWINPPAALAAVYYYWKAIYCCASFSSTISICLKSYILLHYLTPIKFEAYEEYEEVYLREGRFFLDLLSSDIRVPPLKWPGGESP